MAQPVVLLEGDGKTDRSLYRVKSSTVITVGDLVYASNSYVYKATQATLDAKFAGVALDSSASGDTDDVVVLKKGVVEVDATTATYHAGLGLAIAGTNSVADDGGANTIGWVHQYKAGASRIAMEFDVIALQKLHEVNA